MARLVVGLRNPGPDYDGTRHNVGAGVLVEYVLRHDIGFKRAPQRIRADVAEIAAPEARSILAVPRTFMNESGQAVAPLLRYYGVEPEDLLVVHDDIDLPFGRLRVQLGRSSGGNNGVDSIIRSLKTREFWRLKFGVGRPPGRMDPADFVLRRFRSAEEAEVARLVGLAADTLETYIAAGPEAARQRAGELTGKGQE